jgi:hypothetical protein
MFIAVGCFDKKNILYDPSEHLADEIIAEFKGRVVFRQYIPKKHGCFRINNFTLYDATGYTYENGLLRERQDIHQPRRESDNTMVRDLYRKTEVGHKLYMGNFSHCQPCLTN